MALHQPAVTLMQFRIALLGYLLAHALANPCHALEIQGAWEQGAMVVGSVSPGTRVWFEGRPLTLTAGGKFVIGLDRDTPARVSLNLTAGSAKEAFSFEVVQRRYAVQRVDGVPEQTVTPPPEVLERIRSEAILVSKARADSSHREDFLHGFVLPLHGLITGVYGSRRIYNGIPKNPHFGLDIAAPKGALVRAPAPGIVRLAQPDLYFSGGTLIVDHGYGISSTFIHLSEILVTLGQRIETGEAIARVGATGRATGPHLDWRMNWLDICLDPALVLRHFPPAAD